MFRIPQLVPVAASRSSSVCSRGPWNSVSVLSSQLPKVLIRNKHSKRQIKRLYKNPARDRVDQRLGIERIQEPPPALEFLPTYEPPLVVPRSGWAPPAPSRPDYPFSIARTVNKPNNAVGFLPIYPKMRKDGTKVVTRIKKIQGDRERFIRELRAVLQIPIPKNPKDDVIRVRTGGMVEVDGNHVSTLRTWLVGLGF